jgi:hypothetical protein
MIIVEMLLRWHLFFLVMMIRAAQQNRRQWSTLEVAYSCRREEVVVFSSCLSWDTVYQSERGEEVVDHFLQEDECVVGVVVVAQVKVDVHEGWILLIDINDHLLLFVLHHW